MFPGEIRSKHLTILGLTPEEGHNGVPLIFVALASSFLLQCHQTATKIQITTNLNKLERPETKPGGSYLARKTEGFELLG